MEFLGRRRAGVRTRRRVDRARPGARTGRQPLLRWSRRPGPLHRRDVQPLPDQDADPQRPAPSPGLTRARAGLYTARPEVISLRLPLLDELRYHSARVAIGVDQRPDRGVGAPPETADFHAVLGVDVGG